MKDVGLRLLLVMEDSGLSKGEFAQKLNVSQGVISHINSGRNNPGMEMIVECLRKFPDISSDWLLLGTGDMKRERGSDDRWKEVDKLLDEVKLLNDLNYNNLTSRINILKNRVSEF
ncbi:MAG: helix-turn-helix transcriptional regulator [Bacteroidetes bacterium]|nr:helix-turn-helix transcriptional regulator [Bacteroidota bacterium]